MVTVSHIMTEDIINIEAGESAIEAARIMKTHKIGSLFVTRGESIIGIITETDLIRKYLGSNKVLLFIPVEQLMSSPVIGIDEHRPLTEAADLM